MPSMDVPNVTVTLLPVLLSLVHIPRHRLNHFAHPIIKQILRPAPTFLNISCNPTEVSIIAEESSLAAFTKIAEKDARKREKRLEQSSRSQVSPVEVSSSWNALQIDSHSDQLGDAGARIREISALLSGISILYQSSYTTDFIFVQSSKLSQVLGILQNAGFFSFSTSSDNDDGSNNDLSSQMSSLACSSTSSLNDLWAQPNFGTDPSGSSILLSTDKLSTLDSVISDINFRTRDASVDASSLFYPTTSSSPNTHSSSPPSFATNSSPDQTQQVKDIDNTPSNSSVYETATSRRSGSPPAPVPPVKVVPPEIVVVGLSEQSDDHAEAWTMKLIKLLLFPETLPPSPTHSKSSYSSGQEDESYTDSDGSLSSLSSSDDDSGSDSVDGEVDEEEEHVGQGSLLLSGVAPKKSSNRRPPPKPLSQSSPSYSSRSQIAASSSPLSFFSLTRTSDGTSLATDIRLLASLFPPSDRYLVFCGDEFERIESRGRRSDEGSSRILKCLHIDLTTFTLDKHGFVNRFSEVLHKNSINHLYSSTFKTANLLVDENDVERAQALLGEC